MSEETSLKQDLEFVGVEMCVGPKKYQIRKKLKVIFYSKKEGPKNGMFREVCVESLLGSVLSTTEVDREGVV